MKLIIAGSRGLPLTDDEISTAVAAFVATYPKPILVDAEHPHIYLTEVVSGGAPGVDQLGEAWATQRDIPVRKFPADWNKHGRAAGPIRNREMGIYADGALVLWDGKSRGAQNMYETMRKLGKPALCITYGD